MEGNRQSTPPIVEGKVVAQSIGLQMAPSHPAEVISITLIFCLNVYRAIEQSVVHDEAWTYLQFVAQPWRSTFSSYDANNHVLHTLLVKLSCGFLGSSPLPLRLPSLLAGLAFTMIALRLCKMLTSSRTLAMLAFLSLTLNPMILDYLSLARGYSLALATFAYGLLEAFTLVTSEDPRRRHYLGLGASLGLSISANLTFLFPAAGIFLALALLAGLRYWKATEAARVWLDLVRYSAITFVVIAGPILYAPLSHARMVNFYYGSKTFLASIISVVGGSLNYGSDVLVSPLVFAVLAVLVVAAVSSAMLLARKNGKSGPQTAQALFLVLQWTINFAVLLLVGTHRIFGVLYPAGRTGLYLAPCFTLVCLSLINLSAESRHRYWRYAAAVAFVVVMVQFVSRLSVTYYDTWRYDATTNRAFDVIRIMALGHPERKSRIGCSWLYAPALEFYRRINDVQNIEPIQYVVPTPLSGHDFYVLAGGDRTAARSTGLIEVAHYDLSDTTVLVSPHSP
jgi:hypothetical protein